MISSLDKIEDDDKLDISQLQDVIVRCILKYSGLYPPDITYNKVLDRLDEFEVIKNGSIDEINLNHLYDFYNIDSKHFIFEINTEIQEAINLHKLSKMRKYLLYKHRKSLTRASNILSKK